MSSLLQEYFAYVGQLNVYGKSVDILDKLVGIKTNAMQVNKVADLYGKIVAADEHLLQPTLKNIEAKEMVYAEMDGSMIYVKDKGWKEVKVGRIFKASDCVSPEGKASSIRCSQYLSHLGGYKTFTNKMSTLLDNYALKSSQLIFINDGAKWIKNFTEDAFPQATFILDFYHAKEHLYTFMNIGFKDKIAGAEWAEKQCELLLESSTDEVIKNIAEIGLQMKDIEPVNDLINYYQSNKNRMDYKSYKTIGAGLIGSGAIESAHRTLVQSRCKQSGQMWSETGVQNMLNLKTIALNEDWKRVIELTYKKTA